MRHELIFRRAFRRNGINNFFAAAISQQRAAGEMSSLRRLDIGGAPTGDILARDG